MKKILLIVSLMMVFVLTGCGKYDQKDVIRDLGKKLDNSRGYYLEGEMEIINNDDVFKYNVNVSFQKDNNYRVSLKNASNNHEQIILRNSDGVYVLTPSLNKSFKFQSEWPYNNSQIYLLQSLVNDLKKDSKRKFKEQNNYYIFTTKVNYPNNRKLATQIIYLDKKLNVKEVHVLDINNNPQIKMKFNSVDMRATFDSHYFALNENMKTNGDTQTMKEVTTIKDVIYPLFLPTDTHLSSQEKIAKSNGERVILTFAGKKPFMLIEETANHEEESLVIPTFGEPELLNDTIGSVSNNTIDWISNGIEYYLVSDVLTKDELLDVAKSIGTIPVSK